VQLQGSRVREKRRSGGWRGKKGSRVSARMSKRRTRACTVGNDASEGDDAPAKVPVKCTGKLDVVNRELAAVGGVAQEGVDTHDLRAG